jgi:PQQ-dependent catabolism-associated CXXCW motif protein
MMRNAVILAMALLLPAVARAEDPLFDPVTGYRLAHYRGVVGLAPEGIERIDTARAEPLWRAGAIFIDVNPAPGAVRDDATGGWTLAEPHASIPRAHWFPETGRGVLHPAVERNFLATMRKLSRLAPDRPIVIFCQADCWMSWNAALRLRRAGLRNILWFAEGLDGWKDSSLPLLIARPQ